MNNYVSLHVHGRDLTLWLNSFPVVWQSFTIKCIKLHSFPAPEVCLFITNICSDLCSVQTTTVSTLWGHNLGLNLHNPLMCTERRQWEKLDPRCPLAQVQLHQYPVLIGQICCTEAVCCHISHLLLEQWLSSRRLLIYKVFSETLLCAQKQILQGLQQVQAIGNNLHTLHMCSSVFTFLSWQNPWNSQEKQLWHSEDYLCIFIPCFAGPLPPSQQHQTNIWNRTYNKWIPCNIFGVFRGIEPHENISISMVFSQRTLLYGCPILYS